MTNDQETKEILIEEIILENGLTLELYDRSRRMAGDRWLVSFIARMEVEIKPEYFENKGEEIFPFDEIKSILDNKATYQYEKQRIFTDEKEKDDVLGGLKDEFLNINLRYFSNPDFARKLILKQYHEAKRAPKYE